MMSVSAADGVPGEATVWERVAEYRYGDDRVAMLVVELAVIDAMNEPTRRRETAARLANLLDSSDATRAARQFAALQLRQIGTDAEVPALLRRLRDDEPLEEARWALEAIPGEASLAALRECLNTDSENLRIGTVLSLGARRDGAVVQRLIRLVESADENAEIVSAAIWAMSEIASDEAMAFLEAGVMREPMRSGYVFPFLNAVDKNALNGRSDFVERRRACVERLAAAAELPEAARAAVLAWQLEPSGDRDVDVELLLTWWGGDDRVKRRLAAARLGELDAGQLREMAEKMDEWTPDSRVAVLAIFAERGMDETPDLVEFAIRNETGAFRSAAIRLLGAFGRETDLPRLLAWAGSDAPESAAAMDALNIFAPRERVKRFLLDTLRAANDHSPGEVVVACRLLADMVCYEAIGPLVRLAVEEETESFSTPDSAVVTAAHAALRRICDPDMDDLPRLVRLFGAMAARTSAERLEAERTVAVVLGKATDAPTRVSLLRCAMESAGVAWESSEFFPLRARSGDAELLPVLDSWLAGDDPAMRDVAMHCLTNWPDDRAAPALWRIAESPGDGKKSTDENKATMALRAYVRVVTLKSDRSDEETLTLLQNAMRSTNDDAARRWILERAATVRCIACFEWVAGFLDDSDLSLTASRTLVELAHHRFLRHPNMDRVGPVLQRIAETCPDETLRQRAEKYRMGL